MKAPQPVPQVACGRTPGLVRPSHRSPRAAEAPPVRDTARNPDFPVPDGLTACSHVDSCHLARDPGPPRAPSHLGQEETRKRVERHQRAQGTFLKTQIASSSDEDGRFGSTKKGPRSDSCFSLNSKKYLKIKQKSSCVMEMLFLPHLTPKDRAVV